MPSSVYHVNHKCYRSKRSTNGCSTAAAATTNIIKRKETAEAAAAAAAEADDQMTTDQNDRWMALPHLPYSTPPPLLPLPLPPPLLACLPSSTTNGSHISSRPGTGSSSSRAGQAARVKVLLACLDGGDRQR